MVGAEEAVADADHVGAAIVLVVADEDVQLGIEGHVVDVAQAGGEDVQVAAIGPAAEDAAAVEHQAVAFGARHVDAVIAQRQVEPAVVAGDHAVGAVEPGRVLLRRQPQTGQQVAAFIGHAGPFRIAQGGQERGVHHEQRAVVVGEALDGIEALGEDRRLVGVAIAVGVLDEADLIAAHDLGAEARSGNRPPRRSRPAVVRRKWRKGTRPADRRRTASP